MRINSVLLVIVLIGLSACSRVQVRSDGESSGIRTEFQKPDSERKIVRNATMTIEVQTVPVASEKVVELVQRTSLTG